MTSVLFIPLTSPVPLSFLKTIAIRASLAGFGLCGLGTNRLLSHRASAWDALPPRWDGHLQHEVLPCPKVWRRWWQGCPLRQGKAICHSASNRRGGVRRSEVPPHVPGETREVGCGNVELEGLYLSMGQDEVWEQKVVSTRRRKLPHRDILLTHWSAATIVTPSWVTPGLRGVTLNWVTLDWVTPGHSGLSYCGLSYSHTHSRTRSPAASRSWSKSAHSSL